MPCLITTKSALKRLRETKKNKKPKKKFRQNPNYPNLIFPNYTADGNFLKGDQITRNSNIAGRLPE